MPLISKSGSAAVGTFVDDGDALDSRDDIERLTCGGLTRRWLELAAHRGEGPPMIRISRRMVRYRRSAWRRWIADRETGGEA